MNFQQFKIHALLQLRYVDPRLVFKEVAPRRQEPIMGEMSLRNALWIPHIFLANERSSSILGTSEKDVLTSISPDGTVIISTRIQATLHCWMNLQKFPFDEQKCTTTYESCKWPMAIFRWYRTLQDSYSFREIQYIRIAAALGSPIADHDGPRTTPDRIRSAELVDERNHYQCGSA